MFIQTHKPSRISKHLINVKRIWADNNRHSKMTMRNNIFINHRHTQHCGIMIYWFSLYLLIILMYLCTPSRPIIKRFIGKNRNRLCGDHLLVTTEPVIVKMYRKTLVNSGFYKKKLDTRFDTHRIKTGVQFWQIYRSWIQCTMFWRHGALFYGFRFDAPGQ